MSQELTVTIRAVDTGVEQTFQRLADAAGRLTSSTGNMGTGASGLRDLGSGASMSAEQLAKATKALGDMEARSAAAAAKARETGAGLTEMASGAAAAESGLGKVTGFLDNLNVKGMIVAGTIGGITAKFTEVGAAALEQRNQLSAIGAIYRENASAVSEYASMMQDTTTYSDQAARKAFTIAGTLVTNYGMSVQEVSKVVEISADLATMYGYSLEDATQRVVAALRGEAESAEMLGLTMNQSAIDHDNLTLKMGNAEAAAFRFAALQEQAAYATGTAASRVDTMSGAIAQARNRFQDFQVVIGQQLGPVGEFAAAFNGIARNLPQQAATIGLFSSALRDIPQKLAEVRASFASATEKVASFASAQKTIGAMSVPIGAIGIAATAAVGAFALLWSQHKKNEEEARNLAEAVKTLETNIVDLTGVANAGLIDAFTFDVTSIDAAMVAVDKQNSSVGLLGRAWKGVGEAAGDVLPFIDSQAENLQLTTAESTNATIAFNSALSAVGADGAQQLANVAQKAYDAAAAFENGFGGDSFVGLSQDIASITGTIRQLESLGNSTTGARALSDAYQSLAKQFEDGTLTAAEFGVEIDKLEATSMDMATAAQQAADAMAEQAYANADVSQATSFMNAESAKAILAADAQADTSRELSVVYAERANAIANLTAATAEALLTDDDAKLSDTEKTLITEKLARELIKQGDAYGVNRAFVAKWVDDVVTGQMTVEEYTAAVQEMGKAIASPGMENRGLAMNAQALKELGAQLGLTSGKVDEFYARLMAGDDATSVFDDMRSTARETRDEFGLTGVAAGDLRATMAELGSETRIYMLTQDEVILTEREREAALSALTDADRLMLLASRDANLTLEERNRLIGEVAANEASLARARASDAAQYDSDNQKVADWYESEAFQRSPQGVEQTIIALREYDKYVNLTDEGVAELTAEVRAHGLTLDEAKSRADAMSEAQKAEAEASVEAAEAMREINEAAMEVANTYRSALVPGIEGVTNAFAAFITPGDTYLQTLAKMAQAGEVTGASFIDIAAGIETSGAALAGSINQIASVDALGEASSQLVSLLDNLIAAPGELAPVDDWFSAQIVRLEKTGQAYDELGNTTDAYNAVVTRYGELQQAQIDATTTNASIQSDLLAIKLGLIDTEVAQQRELAGYIASLKELAPEEQQRALYLMDTTNQATLATLQSTAYSAALGEIPAGVGTDIIANAAQADPVLADILEGMGIISRGVNGEIQVTLPDADQAIIDKFAQMFPDAQVTKTTSGMISVVNSDGSEAVYTRFGDLVAQDGKRITATVALELNDFTGLMDAGGGAAAANSIVSQMVSDAAGAVSIPIEPMVRPGAADEAIANAFEGKTAVVDVTGNVIGYVNAMPDGDAATVEVTGEITEVTALPSTGTGDGAASLATVPITGAVDPEQVREHLRVVTAEIPPEDATVALTAKLDGEQFRSDLSALNDAIQQADGDGAAITIGVKLDTTAFDDLYGDIVDARNELDGDPITLAVTLDTSQFDDLYGDVADARDELDGDTIAVSAKLDTRAFDTSYTGTLDKGRALASQTFTAKLSALVGPFSDAITDATGRGAQFSAKTFTAKLGGDLSLFSGAAANADRAGASFAAKLYTAKLGGDIALFNAAVANAGNAGGSFAATTFMAKLGADTSLFDSKLSAVGQALTALNQNPKLVSIGADTSRFNEELNRLLGQTLGTAYIRVEPVYAAAPPPVYQPNQSLTARAGGGAIQQDMAEKPVGLTPAGLFSTSINAEPYGAASGRAVVVGEYGPEVAMLPFGSYVTNSTASRSRLQSDTSGADGTRAGQAVGDGFAQGMLDRTPVAAEAAAGLAESAIMAIEQTLEIASPSFVGYEIGRNFGDGFANGIQDRAAIATRIAKAVAKQAAEATDREAKANPVTAPVIVAPQTVSGMPPAGMPPEGAASAPPEAASPPPGAPTPPPAMPPSTPPVSAPAGPPSSLETDWRGRPIKPVTDGMDAATAKEAIAAYKDAVQAWKQAQQDAASAAKDAADQMAYDFYAGLVSGAQSREALDYLTEQANRYADTAVESWKVATDAIGVEITLMKEKLTALVDDNGSIDAVTAKISGMRGALADMRAAQQELVDASSEADADAQEEIAKQIEEIAKQIVDGETQLAKATAVRDKMQAAAREIAKATAKQARMETVGMTTATMSDLTKEMRSKDTGVYEDRAIKEQIAAYGELRDAQKEALASERAIAKVGGEEGLSALSDAAKAAASEYTDASAAMRAAVEAGDVIAQEAAAQAMATAKAERDKTAAAYESAKATYDQASSEIEMNRIRVEEAKRATEAASAARSDAASKDDAKQAYREQQREERRAAREAAAAAAEAAAAAPAVPAGTAAGDAIGSAAGAAIAPPIADGIVTGVENGMTDAIPAAETGASQIASIIDDGYWREVSDGASRLYVVLNKGVDPAAINTVMAFDRAMNALGANAPGVYKAIVSGDSLEQVIDSFDLSGKKAEAAKEAFYSINELDIGSIISNEAIKQIIGFGDTAKGVLTTSEAINQLGRVDLSIVSNAPKVETDIGEVAAAGDSINDAVYAPTVDTGSVDDAATAVDDLDVMANGTGTYTLKVNGRDLNVTIQKAAGSLTTLGDNATGLAEDGSASIGVFTDAVRGTGRAADKSAGTLDTSFSDAAGAVNAAMAGITFKPASKAIERGVGGAVTGIGEIPTAMTDVQVAATEIFGRIKTTMTKNLGEGTKSGSTIVSDVLKKIDAQIAEPSVELATGQFDRDVSQLARDIEAAERDDLNVDVRFDANQVRAAWREALNWMSAFDVTVTVKTSQTPVAASGRSIQALATGGMVQGVNDRNVLVGERGPEVVTLPYGSYVTNSTGSRSKRAETGGTMNLYGPVYITAATPDIAAEIRRQLAGYGRA